LSSKELFSFEDYIYWMHICLADDIYAINVYMRATYAENLLKLVRRMPEDDPLEDKYMEKLSLLFQLENNGSLMLDNKEFADEINSKFLDILKCVAAKRKQELKDDKLFTLMNQILEMNEGDAPDYSLGVLEALNLYTTDGDFQLIPATTIVALENVMEVHNKESESYTIQKKIIQNVIRNGQRVSDKSLQIFADILYTADYTDEDKERRLDAFMILDKSMNNQPDLPDDIFCITELQRAAFGLVSAKVNLNSLEIISDVIRFSKNRLAIFILNGSSRLQLLGR